MIASAQKIPRERWQSFRLSTITAFFAGDRLRQSNQNHVKGSVYKKRMCEQRGDLFFMFGDSFALFIPSAFTRRAVSLLCFKTSPRLHFLVKTFSTCDRNKLLFLSNQYADFSPLLLCKVNQSWSVWGGGPSKQSLLKRLADGSFRAGLPGHSEMTSQKM